MFKTLFFQISIFFGALLAAKTPPSADETMAKEIRHELVMLPYYNVFDNLAYRLDAEKVTLFGQVTQPSLRSDAENAVKRIEGVASVDNQIEVLPLSPFDDHLRIALFHAIYGYNSLQRYALPVIEPRGGLVVHRSSLTERKHGRTLWRDVLPVSIMPK